jgi:DNA-binding MltR family transcriptional regulator
LIDWLEDSERLNAFAASLQKESDRACAVLGAAMLDQVLGDLIRSSMAEDAPRNLFEGYGPIASFSARIDISLGLGLISRDEHYDLHLIRKIRNSFAHEMNHELSFASEPIAHRVAELKVVDAIYANSSFPTSEDTPRIRFQIEVGSLTYSLTGVRAGAVSRAEIPDDYVGWLRMAKRQNPPPNG